MAKNNEQIIIDEDKFEKAENEPINQEAVNKFIKETDKFYPKNSKIMYDYNAKDCEQCNVDCVCCYCKNIACYKLEQQLKQILAEIKELLLITPTDSQEHCINAKSVILQKISEIENE